MRAESTLRLSSSSTATLLCLWPSPVQNCRGQETSFVDRLNNMVRHRFSQVNNRAVLLRTSPVRAAIPGFGVSTGGLRLAIRATSEIRKSAMGVGFVVGVFGVLILAHAAYSTVQYRGLLKIMEEEFSGPPFNVVIELLLGFVLCMWAALTVPGKFLSIHPDSDDNRMVYLPGNLEFMIFNHRGKVFPTETDMKLKH